MARRDATLVDIVLTLLWGVARMIPIIAGFSLVAWIGTRSKEPPYYLAGIAIVLGYLFHLACVGWPMLRFWKNG